MTYQNQAPQAIHPAPGIRWFAMVVAALIACLMARPAPAVTARVSIVAMSGDPVPDGNGTLFSFTHPALNDTGQVAFAACINGNCNEEAGDQAIFRGDGTLLVQIARRAQLAPDANGRLGFLDMPLINDVGQVAFFASIPDASGDAYGGIFRGDGTTLIQIARRGQLAPDGNGRYQSLNQTVLNNAGEVAFKATLSQGANANGGIFRGDGVTLVQIARENQGVRRFDGRIEAFKHIEGPVINESGQVSFDAILEGGSFSTNAGIYRGDGSTLVEIAHGNRGCCDDLYPSALNDAGQVAFWRRAGSGQSIFRGDGMTTVEIAYVGQIAPGGGGFFSLLSIPTLNSRGQATFWSELDLGEKVPSEGIFRGDGTELIQIARNGQAAPDGNGVFSSLSGPALNDSGQASFLAELDGTIGGTTDDLGIFFFDNSLGLLQVARKGDSFLGSAVTLLDFAPHSFRSNPEGGTFRRVNLDHEGSGLNRTGTPRVAYRFVLADGREGIATWTLVPEPGSIVMFAIGANLVIWFGSRVSRRQV